MQRKIASVFGMVALALTTGMSAAHAADVVGNGTPGSCTGAAVVQALAGGGTVSFACGTDPVTIVLPARQTIAADTTIVGADGVVLSGGAAHGLFTVQTGRTLTLDGLTLRDGAVENWVVFVNGGATLNVLGTTIRNCVRGGVYNAGGTVTVADATFAENDASAAGAAITNENGGTLTVARSTFQGNLNGAVFAAGPTTITDSIFEDNRGRSAGGGAILHSKTLTVTRSAFDGNQATAGGAIATSGHLTVEDSLFRDNDATLFDGGAIQLFNLTQTPSSVTIRRSTFDGNAAVRAAGAVRSEAPVGTCTIENATFAKNTAQAASAAELSVTGGTVDVAHATFVSGSAKAIERVEGTLAIRSSIVDGGSCTGVTDGGGNLQTLAGHCGFTTGNAALGTLSENGGLTPTYAIAANSAARDLAAGCVATDQRGVSRPATTCDAGAFERGAVPVLTALEPNAAQAGGPAFAMTVTGSSFLAGTTRVLWNGTPLAVVCERATEVVATVPASLIAAVGVATVTVENPNPPLPDGGVSVESLPFTITDAPPPGACDGLDPFAAVLCELENAKLPGHFCAVADLDAKKLDKPLQKALVKAQKIVAKARDLKPKQLKRRPKVLLGGQKVMDKLALKAIGKRTGITTPECKLAIMEGTTALGLAIVGLPLQ
jgi:predicted outer membrane repeat protein